MTVKQLFALMPNTTNVFIFVSDSLDLVYEGDILHCHGAFKEKEIEWIRLGNNELIINI